MANIVYHSIMLCNKRFKMAEGTAQVTNYQLVLDKCNSSEKESIYKANRVRTQYKNDPVRSVLLNLIMLGCIK